MFYVNDYIDENQFNQLSDLNKMEKDIRNVYAVAHKLGLTLTRATNQSLEVTREEKRKREEIVER